MGAQPRPEGAQRGDRRRDLTRFMAVAAALVAYNTAFPLLPWGLQDRLYVPANLVAAVLLFWWARARWGCTFAELGLEAGHLKRSALAGAIVGATLATPLLVLSFFPHLAPAQLTALQLPRMDWVELAYATAVRIPLGTALWEEWAFRGVLHGLAARHFPVLTAASLSSAAFALWHVGPTIARMTDVGFQGSTALTAGAWTGVLGGTWMGGMLFVLLRVKAAHLAAPVVAHWLINALTTVAVFVYTR